jgi:hypothetical protein
MLTMCLLVSFYFINKSDSSRFNFNIKMIENQLRINGIDPSTYQSRSSTSNSLPLLNTFSYELSKLTENISSTKKQQISELSIHKDDSVKKLFDSHNYQSNQRFELNQNQNHNQNKLQKQKNPRKQLNHHRNSGFAHPYHQQHNQGTAGSSSHHHQIINYQQHHNSPFSKEESNNEDVEKWKQTFSKIMARSYKNNNMNHLSNHKSSNHNKSKK